MAKRRLTEEEKWKLRDNERAKQRARYAGRTIDVHVEDETDHQGNPVIRVGPIKEMEGKQPSP